MKKLILLLYISFSLSYLNAQNFSTTNIQFLNGQNFDEVIDGDSISNGKMKTITIEHFSTWNYGSNFFFVDFTSADFNSGDEHKIYGEWAPRVSISKITKKDLSYKFIKDIYFAGELNQGDNFQSINLGLGLGMDLPGLDFFDVNLFTRKDNFNDRTMQLTVAWSSKFDIVNLPFVFEGFVDYYGIDAGTVLVSQPRFLFEAKGISKDIENLQFGVELYIYHSSVNGKIPKIEETVPQIMLKWIF